MAEHEEMQNPQGKTLKTASGKKLIAKSEGSYRNFIIYELGERNFGILMNKKLVDDFQTLDKVKEFIDTYYAQKKYRWN